ncbi:hypothetical protein BD779DRAFT_1386667, partial [Infundibulicybe gibba]
FFYGTLMHPRILKRVIKNDGSHLRFCPGILLEHTRHQVKDADYPGILPYSQGRKLFDRELTREERSVRGTIVMGLTESDLTLLDYFEGEEYRRETVKASPLEPMMDLSGFILEPTLPKIPPPLPSFTDLADPLDVEVYIYEDPNNLKARLWSFSDFVEQNAWKWYDKDPE